jgi:hypothetical protein
MWAGILLVVAAAGVIAAIWIIKSKNRNNEKVTYACSHCGETHCDCYLEDKS